MDAHMKSRSKKSHVTEQEGSHFVKLRQRRNTANDSDSGGGASRPKLRKLTEDPLVRVRPPPKKRAKMELMNVMAGKKSEGGVGKCVEERHGQKDGVLVSSCDTVKDTKVKELNWVNKTAEAAKKIDRRMNKETVVMEKRLDEGLERKSKEPFVISNGQVKIKKAKVRFKDCLYV